MYQLPSSLLVKNPIHRYLLNSTMLPHFHRDLDGGIALRIQHQPPGKELQPNWLPAPDGPFIVILRLYYPKAEALNRTWTPPRWTRLRNERLFVSPNRSPVTTGSAYSKVEVSIMWKQAAYLLASFSVAFVGCKSNTPAAGPSAQGHGDVRSIAKQAYIYAYAPVYMERQRRNFVSVDKDIGDGTEPAGFALVKKGSDFSGDGEVWEMADFFVVRGARGRGLGYAVAENVWRRFRGPWEIHILTENVPAQHFWTKAISRFLGRDVKPALATIGAQTRYLFLFDSA
jgi:GNAT superfamily N-acetyltransferase